MILSTCLFHWSPSDRREAIRREGLRPFCDPTVSSSGRFAYVSLSPSPSRAWGLSGDMAWVSEVEEWDLWQVELPDNAEVHVRPFFGRVVEEIKVFSTIPPDCIWLVASRSQVWAEANILLAR